MKWCIFSQLRPLNFKIFSNYGGQFKCIFSQLRLLNFKNLTNHGGQFNPSRHQSLLAVYLVLSSCFNYRRNSLAWFSCRFCQKQAAGDWCQPGWMFTQSFRLSLSVYSLVFDWAWFSPKMALFWVIFSIIWHYFWQKLALFAALFYVLEGDNPVN